MNTALKLRPQFVQNPLFQECAQQERQSATASGMLGFHLLPAQASVLIEKELKNFVEELENNVASTDIKQVKRRKQVVFWVKTYLRGDCSLHWLVEMLERVPS